MRLAAVLLLAGISFVYSGAATASEEIWHRIYRNGAYRYFSANLSGFPTDLIEDDSKTPFTDYLSYSELEPVMRGHAVAIADFMRSGQALLARDRYLLAVTQAFFFRSDTTPPSRKQRLKEALAASTFIYLPIWGSCLFNQGYVDEVIRPFLGLPAAWVPWVGLFGGLVPASVGIVVFAPIFGTGRFSSTVRALAVLNEGLSESGVRTNAGRHSVKAARALIHALGKSFGKRICDLALANR